MAPTGNGIRAELEPSVLFHDDSSRNPMWLTSRIPEPEQLSIQMFALQLSTFSSSDQGFQIWNREPRNRGRRHRQTEAKSNHTHIFTRIHFPNLVVGKQNRNRVFEENGNTDPPSRIEILLRDVDIGRTRRDIPISVLTLANPRYNLPEAPTSQKQKSWRYLPENAKKKVCPEWEST